MKSTNIGKAVITGASSGIGAIYADRLAKRGFAPILVARDEKKLKIVYDRIFETTGKRSEIIIADLGSKEGRKKLEDKLKGDNEITLLVNNAGFGSAAPLIDSELDKMESMIDINVTALMRLSGVAASEFVKKGKGTIINIASIVGIVPETLNGVYGGTKAFVVALTQSMHHELSSKGIRVQAVLPGATRTEFWNVSGLPVEHLPQEWVMSAEDMVDASLVGLDAGEVITIPPLANKSDWEEYEAKRLNMKDKLSNSKPAARYLHS